MSERGKRDREIEGPLSSCSEEGSNGDGALGGEPTADGEIFSSKTSWPGRAFKATVSSSLARDQASAISGLDHRRREKHGALDEEGAGQRRLGKTVVLDGVARAALSHSWRRRSGRAREMRIRASFSRLFLRCSCARTYLLGRGELLGLAHAKRERERLSRKMKRREGKRVEPERRRDGVFRWVREEESEADAEKIEDFSCSTLTTREKNGCSREKRRPPRAFFFLFAVPPPFLCATPRQRKQNTPAKLTRASRQNGVRRDAVGPDARQPPAGRRDDARRRRGRGQEPPQPVGHAPFDRRHRGTGR